MGSDPGIRGPRTHRCDVVWRASARDEDASMALVFFFCVYARVLWCDNLDLGGGSVSTCASSTADGIYRRSNAGARGGPRDGLYCCSRRRTEAAPRARERDATTWRRRLCPSLFSLFCVNGPAAGFLHHQRCKRERVKQRFEGCCCFVWCAFFFIDSSGLFSSVPCGGACVLFFRTQPKAKNQKKKKAEQTKQQKERASAEKTHNNNKNTHPLTLKQSPAAGGPTRTAARTARTSTRTTR